MDETFSNHASDLQRAVIFGCSGLELNDDERAFFERSQPLGFILFARNCESPDQVRQLIHSLKETVRHAYVPILIDQEGGRVARLHPPHWRDSPPASVFGKMAQDDLEEAIWAVRENSYLIGLELNALGINVNCAPVADLFHLNTHQVIGDRAFSDDPVITAKLAVAAAEGLIAAGVTPVLKHFPGHGRALVDSHENLPIVTTSLERLGESDFDVFRQICLELPSESCWGMTAHILYEAADSKNPATQSNVIIQGIIRQHISFKGFLISDCVTMEALSGSYADRARRSLDAGCDAVLHCSGVLEEMVDLFPAVPILPEPAKTRLFQAFPTVHARTCRNLEEIEAKLAQKLRPYTQSLSTPTFSRPIFA